MDVTSMLGSYDWIVVSTSGGKDSQTMLGMVAALAHKAGVFDRVVAVHAELGPRIVWPKTLEIVQAQCEHHGVPLLVCTRIGEVARQNSAAYRAGEVYGDLLDYVERRRMWPGIGQTQFCTSDFKRGPIQKVYTQLAQIWRTETGEKRPCRILDCIGLRAQESARRKAKPPFQIRNHTANQHIDTWLPIHWATTEQVWSLIKEFGSPHHYAYDLGMTRFSCAFCIYANRGDLAISAKANPTILKEYLEVEERIGFTFKVHESLAELTRG